MSYQQYNLQMDVTLYTEQLQDFDKAIASQAFAELPESEKAARLRARGWLEAYLQEAQEDLKVLAAIA